MARRGSGEGRPSVITMKRFENVAGECSIIRASGRATPDKKSRAPAPSHQQKHGPLTIGPCRFVSRRQAPGAVPCQAQAGWKIHSSGDGDFHLPL